jgi:hypothetical protein
VVRKLEIMEPLTAERLFEKVFLPLYPPQADLAKLRSADANPANNPAILAGLVETADLFARLAPEALDAPDLALDFSDASIHRLAPLLTLDRRAKLMERKGAAPPLLAHFTIHGAVYVGACVVRNHSGKWLVRSPLWETMVELTSRAGTAHIAPFAWWLRAWSDEEIGRSTLLDRYRTHVETPTFDPATLEPIAPADRRLPRLEKVRYDLLYKYLKAHLPEVKDVGADFPSPERFEEMGFRWLEPRLVGEGRVLVLFGPTKTGVAALFLTKQGFSKQHYYEGFSTDPRLEVEGDRLRFVLGPEEVHETFYWGG